MRRARVFYRVKSVMSWYYKLANHPATISFFNTIRPQDGWGFERIDHGLKEHDFEIFQLTA